MSIVRKNRKVNIMNELNISSEIAKAYLEGQPIQVNYNNTWFLNTDQTWHDIPQYEVPSDILRLSCVLYKFRIKPND